MPRKAGRFVFFGLLAAALAAVFWLYLQPGLIVDLAARIWSCV
jgi:hypothetical protein